MRDHREPLPVEPCNAIAPTLELHRCHRERGHCGHHAFNSIVRWDDTAPCPVCRGPWNGTDGKCEAHDCIGKLRERCRGCGLRAGEVFDYTRCAGCKRVVCGTCKQELEGRAFCPECLPVALEAVAGGSGRPQGAGARERGDVPASCTPGPPEAA